MRRAARWAAFVLAVGGTSLAMNACGGTCGLGGPGTIFEPVVSAQYGATVTGDPGVTFPWIDADGAVDVAIDRAAGTVVVAYQRHGAPVVETWRVTASR